MCAGLLAILMIGCEADNCPTNAIASVHLDFTDQHGQSVKVTDTVTIVGIAEGIDSTGQTKVVRDTIVNRQASTSSLTLPLSYATSTKFLLIWSQAPSDTINITHRNIPHYLNNQCGTMMFYEIQDIDYTNHMFDSVKVINNSVDNYEKRNLQVYFTLSASR